MVKTTKKQLIEEFIQKAQEMKDEANQLQSAIIQEARKEYHKVKLNTLLSPEGKDVENEAIRQFYANEFLRKMDVIKTKYERYLANAKNLALEITSAPIQYDGTDAQKAAFEQSLHDLKVRVALIPDQAKAVGEITKFVQSQSNPYFAQQVANNFGELIAPFATTKSAELKVELSKAYDTAKRNAVTEETRYAREVLDINDDAKLVLTIKDSQSYQALQSVIGRRAASNANTPADELNRIKQGDVDEKGKHQYGEQESEEQAD